MTNTIPEIIDISSWKQDIDHRKVADAGVKVAICRTTVSQVSADLAYQYHVQEFNKVGIEVPGYMFPQFEYDVIFQVKCFVAMLRWAHMPPILDLERTNACDDEVIARKTTVILHEIMRRTGRIPIIYTRGRWFDIHIGPYVHWAGRYPLWVAHYTRNIRPIIPKGWKDYILWQYSDSGRVPGIRSSVDFNRKGDNYDDTWHDTFIPGPREDRSYLDNPSW